MRRHEASFMIYRAAALMLGLIYGMVPARAGGAGNVLPACSVVSRPEVEDVLGAHVGDGRPQVATDALTVCSYAAESGGNISLLLRRHAGRDWSAEQARRMSQSAKFRAVAGLGQQAFVFDLGRPGLALCVFYRDYYLQVSTFGAGEGIRLYPVAERLARIALQRLEPPPDINQIARAARGRWGPRRQGGGLKPAGLPAKMDP